MHRQEAPTRLGRNIVLFAALATTGLAAGIFVSGRGPSASALLAGALSERTTHVKVSATDSRFKLSKGRAVTGTVIFTVTNKGKATHDFKIAGKKTPRLAPRHSATMRVTFSKTGRYPYRSTVHGQAAAGLKGVFVIVPAPPPPTTTTTSTTIGHAQTTVNVGMHVQPTHHFTLSPAIVPSGMVTFVITSFCNAPGCSFDLVGIHAGAILTEGMMETWTVPLPPGTYNFHCDVAPQLMNGVFVVTP